jgi:hypothetical protein
MDELWSLSVIHRLVNTESSRVRTPFFSLQPQRLFQVTAEPGPTGQTLQRESGIIGIGMLKRLIDP